MQNYVKRDKNGTIYFSENSLVLIYSGMLIRKNVT